MRPQIRYVLRPRFSAALGLCPLMWCVVFGSRRCKRTTTRHRLNVDMERLQQKAATMPTWFRSVVHAWMSAGELRSSQCTSAVVVRHHCRLLAARD